MKKGAHLVMGHYFQSKSCQIKGIHDKTKLITGLF